MATLNEAFQNAVKSRIGGNKKHGWGNDDSVEVILAVVAEETGTDKADLQNLLPFIKVIVNPSSFRQALESTGVLEKTESGKRSSAVKGLLRGMT